MLQKSGLHAKKTWNSTRSDIVFEDWDLIKDSYFNEILRTFEVTIYNLCIFPIFEQNWFTPVSGLLQRTRYFGDPR